MPFTASHAALVLPLLRVNPRYLSATALVIGSMAPDFEYFFRMSSDGKYGHTLWGLLYFDLPVTVFLALVFHLVVKQTLVAHLPVFFQVRLQPLLRCDMVAYLRQHGFAFAVAAVVGGASHIFWDSFTHGDGYFATRLSIYHHFVPFDGVRYPLWYALQNICSWIGLAAVLIYVCYVKPEAGVVHRPSLWYWCFVLLVAMLVVGLRFQFEFSHATLGNRIITSISGLCIAVVLAGVMRFRMASGYR